MNEKKWPNHFYVLDFSRGIAALSVVLWHWQHFAYIGIAESFNFEKKSQPLYGVFCIFYEAGAMGVQYFFIVSGFIFFWLYANQVNNRAITGWKFSVHRFSRLYPLHFVTLVIVAILQIIYVSREHSAFIYQYNDVYHFFLNLFYATRWGFESGHSFNASIWSVSVEIVLYFTFFLTLLFRKGGCFFCLFISFLSLIIARLTDNVILGGMSLFFLGGTVYYLTKFIVLQDYKLKVSIYIATISCWCMVIIDFYIIDFSSNILSLGIFGKILLRGFSFYILFPLTICSLILAEIDNGALFKPMAWVGDISYSSYLIHFPLQLIFALGVSYGILSKAFYLRTEYLLLFFLILIPLSYFTFIKFEKPIQKFLRNKLL
jgi:peptidoglycan/LPS O-acetylase OafA/YrhL